MKIYLFIREGAFYPLELKDDADAIVNARCNPGTIRVEDPIAGRVVWNSIQDEKLLVLKDRFKALTARLWGNNHIGQIQRQETEKAFMFGAAALFYIIHNECTELSDEDAEKALQKLENELNQYFKLEIFTQQPGQHN